MESIIDRVFNIIDTNNILGLRTLLQDGLDPNIRNHSLYEEEEARETALMYASTVGHIDIIRLLLQYNADPNLTDYEGETALAMAIPLDTLDNESIVKTLLEYNADPNLQNVNGNTPLILAAIFNQINIVHLLLDNGADPFMKNIRGDTALDIAQIYFNMGDVDREVIDLLKNRMATIRLQSRHRGRKTRHKLRTSMARRRSALSQVADEYGLEEDIIDMLNSRITRPSHLDMIDETPRNLLSQGEIGNKNLKKTQKKQKRKRKKKRKKRYYGGSNNLKGGMFLLPTRRLKYTEVEPDFSVYDTDVLKRAVEKGNIKVLKRFIENGINLDFKYKSLNGYHSNTLLITASENGYTDIVELLLKNGANTDIFNSADTTALMEACHNQHPLIVELLLRHGADPNIFKTRGPTALILAVNKDDVKITELLLEYNADPNFRMKGNGDTPLMFASRQGNTEIATLLLERGANPNILKLDTDNSNNTALIMAAMKNRAPMVELLLEYNADPNLKNTPQNHTGSLHDIYFGSTALHWASMEENYDIIKMLLEHGADPNIMNIRFKTPLYISVKNGNFNAVKIMLEHNGDATEIYDGETLLYIIASRYEYKNDIAKLLIERGVDINAQNINGFTALHKAIIRYNISLVRILLENGADPYIINSANENSLEYAEDLKRLDRIQGLNYDDIDVIIAIIKTYMSAINIQKTFRGRQTRNKLKTELAEKQLVQAKLPFGFQESELIGEQLRLLYPSSIRS